jgi:hypothetical protein
VQHIYHSMTMCATYLLQTIFHWIKINYSDIAKVKIDKKYTDPYTTISNNLVNFEKNQSRHSRVNNRQKKWTDSSIL